MYYNEDFDTDDEYDIEEVNEQLEDEKHFDKYFDEIQKTYDDLKDFVHYNAKNKNLLQNLQDYMYLEVLFDDKEYKYSESFENRLKLIKEYENKDNIYIPPPFDYFELYDDNGNLKETPKQEWVTLTNKNTKKIKERQEKMKKRKERVRKLREKRKREEMTKRTKEIMKRYGLF